jgi:hypothetical protein
LTGTVVAFLISLLFPLVKPDEELLKIYVRQSLPPHAIAMGMVAGVLSLTIIILIMGKKVWHSLRLGLVRFPTSAWGVCITVFWLLIAGHRNRPALGIILGATALALLSNFLRKRAANVRARVSEVIENDQPVPENGEDLLGRRSIIDTLIARILFEQPLVIAVTAPYGDGKTSFLNLVVGEMRKVDVKDRPIIVKFSPWLAGDSNAVVLSLLNSIVSEMNKSYVVPGLKRDVVGYARTLLSVIPKVERLSALLSEPSQVDRVNSLAKRISETNRRVLVVLDDLDRMEAKELETVFKLLRGSESFVNFTFVCSFDKAELGRILKANRPHQEIDNFLEKFFQLFVPLPPVDYAQLRDLFLERVTTVLARYSLSQDDTQKSFSKLWENGAGTYFRNLRRIKLFLNRIDHSLARIGAEVNVTDFVGLELVRDIAPSIYEEIYLNPEHFYDADLAFEVAFTRRAARGDSEVKQERAKYYERILEPIPPDKRYVSKLLEDLFPHFAQYKNKSRSGSVDANQAEKSKRIFHPRCFRQYFLLKVPSELFSQEEFNAFLSSIRNASEEGVIATFNKTFQAVKTEDFKRYHFVHRIETIFDDLGLATARGLCRALAQNSSIWTSDAFEFLISVRCTRKTLLKMKESSERESFLQLVVLESSSSLCALLLVEILEKEARETLPSDLQQIRHVLKNKLRERYLTSGSPSIFEELSTDMGRIEPIQFLMGWRRLGPDAELDQKRYLVELFNRRPTDLNFLLKSMFRVEFLDDYNSLKPLFDYDRLAELINKNAALLDSAKVEEFRTRYEAERGAARTS